MSSVYPFVLWKPMLCDGNESAKLHNSSKYAFYHTSWPGTFRIPVIATTMAHITIFFKTTISLIYISGYLIYIYGILDPSADFTPCISVTKNRWEYSTNYNIVWWENFLKSVNTFLEASLGWTYIVYIPQYVRYLHKISRACSV